MRCGVRIESRWRRIESLTVRGQKSGMGHATGPQSSRGSGRGSTGAISSSSSPASPTPTPAPSMTTSSAAASTLSCARHKGHPWSANTSGQRRLYRSCTLGRLPRRKEGSIPGTMKLAPASTIRFYPLPASPPIQITSRRLVFSFRSIDARGGDLFGLTARCGSSLKWGDGSGACGRVGLGVARRERNGRINYGRGNDRVNSGHLGGERWGFGEKATATFWAVPNGEARLRVCRGGSDLGASE